MAELMGTLLYANTFTADCIRIVTESAEFARRLPYLLRKAAATKFDVLPEAGVAGKLTLCVTDLAKIAHIFARCGFSAETSVSLHVNLGLLENDCCRRAFLRGAFLAGGSVTDPEKRYHLELSTTHLKVSRETELLLDELALKPKATKRKGSSVLYFKQSEAIEDFLTLIGAPVSAMAVMSAKIEKDWRNDANRKTNCDAPMSTRPSQRRRSSLPRCGGSRSAGNSTPFRRSCGRRRSCAARIRRSRFRSLPSCMSRR